MSNKKLNLNNTAVMLEDGETWSATHDSGVYYWDETIAEQVLRDALEDDYDEALAHYDGDVLSLFDAELSEDKGHRLMWECPCLDVAELLGFFLEMSDESDIDLLFS